MDFGARRRGSVPSQLHRGQANHFQHGGWGTAIAIDADGAATRGVENVPSLPTTRNQIKPLPL